MADYLPALQDAVYGAIAAVWPEIVLPGSGERPTVFTTLQALQVSIVEFTKDGIAGDGRPAPPYAFVDIGRSEPEAGFCPSLDIQRAPIAIYYVDVAYEGHDTDQVVVSGKLWALKRAVDAGSNLFQTETKGRLDTSPSSPVVKALAAASKIPLVAGHVLWTPGLLVAYDY